ncbi:hypothetical protein GCM10023319_76040 [Nocardia iowensis]
MALQVWRGGARPGERARGLESPNPDGLPLPSRAGTPRSPNNFNRTFGEARETEFEWVTLRTLRKAVSTRVYERTKDGAATRAFPFIKRRAKYCRCRSEPILGRSGLAASIPMSAFGFC